MHIHIFLYIKGRHVYTHAEHAQAHLACAVTHAYFDIQIYTHILSIKMWTCAHPTCVIIHINLNIQIYTHIVSTDMCTRAGAHFACMSTHTYFCIHTYIHTYSIHKYVYTRGLISPAWLHIHILTYIHTHIQCPHICVHARAFLVCVVTYAYLDLHIFTCSMGWLRLVDSFKL